MKSNFSIVTFILFLFIFVENYCFERSKIIDIEDNLRMQNNFESLLKKANKPEKKTIPKKKSKYKVKVKKNSLIKHKEKEKHSFYNQCVIKTGIIDIILKRPFAPIYVIKTTPVLVIITKDEISVYKDLKKTKLIHKFKIEDIQRVDQHYENTLCFDIIVNKIDDKNVLNTGPLSFCAENKQEFNKWLKSILEFKQCSINIKNVESNKVLIDFKKINYSKKVGSGENSLSEIYYNGEDKFHKNSLINVQKTSSLNHAFELLKNNFIRNKLAKRMIQRQYAGKMKSSRSFKETFLKNRKSIKNTIENKFFSEKEKEFKELRKIHHSKELGMILKTIYKLNEIKRMEIINYKKELEDKLSKQNLSTKDEAKKLLSIKLDEQKLTDYTVCYSDQLKGFKDKKYIEKLCKHYYGETGYKLCKKRTSFCLMCCEFHIGSDYPKKRVFCRLKCKRKINQK